jgi:hypothetical protein
MSFLDYHSDGWSLRLRATTTREATSTEPAALVMGRTRWTARAKFYRNDIWEGGMFLGTIGCWRSVVVGCAVAALLGANAASAFQFITEKEAALPLNLDPKRGITRGPIIIALSPAPGSGLVTSPLHFKVKFEGRGGAKIDAESTLVTYEKLPAVDLTQRIRAFVGPDGIDVENAEVPPGTHRIRIDVRDTDGRTGSIDLIFTVAN